MLQNLHVKNLALIDEAEAFFRPGFNVLTGETGAGKSIILGCINLALGGKYKADMLRANADYGLCELSFLVEDERTVTRLKALDIEPDEGQIIISRKFTDSKSICRINGETVTASKVKEAAQVLIDIHGQHEHQSLLYKKNHLSILDAFVPEAAESKAEISSAVSEYRRIRKELQEAKEKEESRRKEMDFLAFEIREIEEAGLRDGEDEELEDSYRRMKNGQKNQEALEGAYEYVSQASDPASRSVHLLSDIANAEKRAGELYSQALDIESLLSDLSREIRDYLDDLSFSPEQFREVEDRLNEINHLKSKYGNSVPQIHEYLGKQKALLDKYEHYDEYLSELTKALAKKETELGIMSRKLSEARKKEAKSLRENVIMHLKDLNFLNVEFDIAFEEREECGTDGIDEVEFMISMNPGQPLRPLAEVASGGELSRIMLALKTVLADKDEIPTLIFDEIDVGISGRTAQKVSEKMGFLGKNHQVLCITHLAQIAAMADAHFLIEKAEKDGKTITDIRPLEGEEITMELARILGGAKITPAVIENAKEMKELADSLKK